MTTPPMWLENRDWHEALLFLVLSNTAPVDLRKAGIAYDKALLDRLESLSDKELKKMILQVDPSILTTSTTDFFADA